MSFPYKISGYNRKRKWEVFLRIINPDAKTTILDAGFSDKEYSATDNYLEKNYAYPAKITALGVDQPREFLNRYPQIKAVQYDGRIFPFGNKQFDVCWSNAVIEHVGSKEKQILFLKEISRVAKRAFITTPNKHFPFEVHTRVPLLHLLPKPIFDKFLHFIGKDWAAGDYMNLLSLKDLKSLLQEAGIADYQIIKNRFFFFVIDFVVIF